MASEWYYSIDGEKTGPVTSAELRRLASTGELKPSDLVWKEGMATWSPVNSMKGLLPEGVPPIPQFPNRGTTGRAAEGFRVAADAADRFSSNAGFLDLKFTTYLTPKLIGLIFVVSLVFLALSFVGSTIYALWTQPALLALFVIFCNLVAVVLMAIWIRVLLEVCLLGFRAVEHLKQLDNLSRISGLIVKESNLKA
jgi:hypothetical protein